MNLNNDEVLEMLADLHEESPLHPEKAVKAAPMVVELVKEYCDHDVMKAAILQSALSLPLVVTLLGQWIASYPEFEFVPAHYVDTRGGES